MKKYFLSLGLIIFECAVVRAQCNCEENFEFVYNKTKINYAGWKDKTTVDPTGFEKFTEQQRQKSKSETQKNYCYKIIQDWLNYFRDHHTHLYSNTATTNYEGKSEDEIREIFSQSEKLNITESEAIKFFTVSGIEGIWEMIGGDYRVAIIKSKTAYRDFAAVILRADSVYWVPGQIKIELTEENPGNFSAMFYLRNHSLRLTTATLKQGELQIEGLNSFRRVYPQSTVIEPIKSDEVISQQIELRKMDKTTLYFRLPTFNHLVKNVVDSLIQANHDLITETPNLILDVRNNGGGSDVTYGELIQYLYTDKITLINNSIWSSEDNIQKFENILEDPEYPKSGKNYVRGLIKKLKANPNSFVRKNDNVIRRRAVLSVPRNIIVLINRGCASSCEEFVLAARQSKKVTLMGENTMGVLDYANVHHLNLPCSEWGFQYATSRSNRLPEFPIDNIGVAPTIKIPEEQNWVEFALEYLKGK